MVAYGGWWEKSKKRVMRGGSAAGGDLVHVMGLWICSRGGGDTALRAYIGENGLDDVKVGHLGALWR